VRFSDFSGRTRALFRTRAALGLNPLAAPIMVFIPLGILLGPSAMGVISHGALAHLDIVISIALATLGVVIGIAAGREVRAAGRLLAAATIEAGITIAVVVGAVLILLQNWMLPLEIPFLLAALALGVCASASAAPPVDVGDERAAQIAGRVADLDDVLPIVLGGVVLAMARPTELSSLASTALTTGLGLAIGLCGWLLVERAEVVAERAVFVLGTLAMLGGAPAYMGLSPLLTGMAAGVFWVAAPGRCDAIVARELRKVQHPIVVLVLITAGASLQLTTAGIWLLAPYVIFRSAGKILGGWTASRLAPGIAPSDLGAYLIPPGVIGIAFALNLQQVAHEPARSLVFAVAIGAIASETLALVVTPKPRPA
jgi:hypothetical protein